jgi:uncharacterized protein YkwD
MGVRILRGVSPLYHSATLKARWITTCHRFTHTPCGHSFRSVFSNYMQGASSIGENLGWGTGPLARVREMFAGWLHSPEHRKNIVRPEWREIGIERIQATRLFGHEDVALWVAHFGSP